jgi:hypothetical protein
VPSSNPAQASICTFPSPPSASAPDRLMMRGPKDPDKGSGRPLTVTALLCPYIYRFDSPAISQAPCRPSVRNQRIDLLPAIPVEAPASRPIPGNTRRANPQVDQPGPSGNGRRGSEPLIRATQGSAPASQVAAGVSADQWGATAEATAPTAAGCTTGHRSSWPRWRQLGWLGGRWCAAAATGNGRSTPAPAQPAPRWSGWSAWPGCGDP